MKGFIPIVMVIVIGALVAGSVLYLTIYPFTPINTLSPSVDTVSSSTEEVHEKTQKSKEKAIYEPRIEPKPTAQKPNQPPYYEGKIQKTGDPWRNPIPGAPTNLFLPIFVQDINVTEELLSPYGIIRKSGDGGIGHGGIDFPLERGSPIYAVDDGTIIKNNVEDSGGGKTVDVLIMPGEFQGEGWIFKYDHVALEPGFAVGSSVQKGQKIGTNAFTQRGNNHIGLEYHIENFTIAREKICWVDRLEPTARQQLEDKFNQIKKTLEFIRSWQTANEEGYYQYKGLLDTTKYPDGPQLCYPLGLDARTPI